MVVAQTEVGRDLALAGDTAPRTPYLHIDLDVIEDGYRRLESALPSTTIYYAVKANPEPEVLRALDRLGANFDCASIYEIEQCLTLGIEPHRLSFGNTIKKRTDIAAAHRLGVPLYAFDSVGELEKLAEAAPGSRVMCRMLVSCDGAEWPLSRKFGCEQEMATDLLLMAARAGLRPCGLSFHVGSQQTDPGQWDAAVAAAAEVFATCRRGGLELTLLNLGGGFPAQYRSERPEVESYGQRITAALQRAFGADVPDTIVEPGRGIAGDAGVIVSEVVLVSRKAYGEERRWVYLDVGVFGGLPETLDESIRYRISTPHDSGPCGPVVLAGPTCDSMDVLYEDAGYELPLALRDGDRVWIHGTGAYTATYSSVAFNGFPPLATVVRRGAPA